MDLIIGLICGLSIWGVFFVGYIAGKKASQRSRSDPPSVAAEERKRIQEDHEAFQKMMNYSADVAYQIAPAMDGPGGEVLR